MKIKKSNNLPEQSVTGAPEIVKKVFFENGEVPYLTTIATATFLPGQSVGDHTHETMCEVFYILEGRAVFECGGVTAEVSTGDCISIPAGSTHKQSNPFNDPVTWIYWGIATK